MEQIRAVIPTRVWWKAPLLAVAACAWACDSTSGDPVRPAIPDQLPNVTLSGFRFTFSDTLRINATVGQSNTTVRYEAVVTNPSTPVGTGFTTNRRAVIQHWVEQNSAKRAAGGAVWSPCLDGGATGVIPAGVCSFISSASSPDNQRSGGTGILVPGPATLLVEIILQNDVAADNIILATLRQPITLIED